MHFCSFTGYYGIHAYLKEFADSDRPCYFIPKLDLLAFRFHCIILCYEISWFLGKTLLRNVFVIPVFFVVIYNLKKNSRIENRLFFKVG